MNLLFWITSAVEAAVLKGVAQAIEKLGMESDTESDPLAELRARMPQTTAIAAAESASDNRPARRAR